MTAHIANINIERSTPLIVPGALKRECPSSDASYQTVIQGRREIEAILQGQDTRMLVIIGPCSIHDTKAAVEYAQRLAELRQRYRDRLCIVMRVYFEKPRTTVGWKGLINDPYLDGSFDIPQGLRLARKLLSDITALGLPAGTEMLEPITPQYIDDLVSWAAIGARTTESQTHRQMASGLSTPVGFKNSTNGDLQVALDAMKAARSPHHFLGIDEEGVTCVVSTKGNPFGHMILRGGKDRPNYDPRSVAEAIEHLKQASLSPYLMIDCSHANSGKKHEAQEKVWDSILEQRANGCKELIGAMVESNLSEGNQALPADRSTLKYGVSITDACIGWDKTAELLERAYKNAAT